MKSALHLAPQRSLACRYLAGFGAVVAPLSLLGQTALGLAMTKAHRCGVISVGPMRRAVFSTRYLRASWQTPRASVLPHWAALVLRMHGLQSRQHRPPGDPIAQANR